MEKSFKRYNLIYLKKSITLCFCLNLPVVLLFFVVMLFNDAISVFEEVLLVASIAILPPMLVGVNGIIRFNSAKRLFETQNKQQGLRLDLNDAEQLCENGLSPIFVTENVIIFCGKLVLHRDFIKSHTVRVIGKADKTRYLVFRCANGKKYSVFAAGTSTVKKVKEWLKKEEMQQ